MSATNPLMSKTTRLRIGLRPTAELRSVVNRATVPCKDAACELPPDDENNYWAEAIQHGTKFSYRVGDTTVPISADEYCQVVAIPTLYYFSAALRLHHRVLRARSGTCTID